ncbi:hypothetical protein V5T82_16560 [Magnetovibrio sp. PR-2]|uniref:hypothetical protein n=1 Tax=Magnetovibrio sp. PR-2 TaxID=3120356 RepID=UPI002FCE5E4F
MKRQNKKSASVVEYGVIALTVGGAIFASTLMTDSSAFAGFNKMALNAVDTSVPAPKMDRAD